MRRTIRSLATLAVTALIVAVAAPAALADDIYNDLDGTIDAVAEVMALNVGGPAGTTHLYVQPRNGDGKNGCNLTASTTLALSVASSATAVATVSPSSVTFASCGDVKTLTVTPVSAGSSTISVSQTSNNTGGTFNLAPATFTATVAPPANTAPTVSVAGVDEGATYDVGSVPAATCQVTDSEDGNSSFPATLSAVTGPYAADGIGSQTASCSYTDGGGLTASASETYSIVDPSAPVITYTLTPSAPDGDNGWYHSDVSLVWNVAEPQSPSSLSLTGCANQSITADQPATTYSCSASSAGGSAGSVGVTIKRDATAPSVDCTPPDDSVWYDANVTVPCAAGDEGPSGLADTADEAFDLSTSVAVGDETDSATTDSRTVADAAGNDVTAGPYTFKVDRKAPTAVSGAPDRTPDSNGWYNHAVDVVFTGTDGGSGIDSCTTTTYGGPDGTGLTVNGSCTDGVGNTSADVASSAFDYDASAPGIDCVVPDDSVWYGANVTVPCTAGDEGPSGLADPSDGSFDLSTSVAAGDETDTATTGSRTVADVAGNDDTAGPYTFKVDRKAPTGVSGAPDRAADHNGWYNHAVDVVFTGTDGGSGIDSCTTATYDGPDGAGSSVNGSCTDGVGNTSAEVASSAFDYDGTDPTLSWSGGPADGGVYYFGAVPAAGTCNASDGTSGPDGCAVTGYSGGIGVHTLEATAHDVAGNSHVEHRTYEVKAWTLTGFYKPVDMSTTAGVVVNTVKNGSTVPLKFEVFAGPTELTSTSVVQSFTVQNSSVCGSAVAVDAIEFTTTGGTSLRYDGVAGQFIQNWQTPKKAGACLQVTMTTQDGSTIVAYFKLK